MPRNFFRFPSKEHTNAPPTPPPKAEEKKISPPIPLNDTIRSRRVTSPVIPPGLGVPPKANATRLPHRASASDSFAQGSAWRASQPTITPPTNQTPEYKPRTRPLRRSKGHQPIADERERRTKAESLLREHTKLRDEINAETIRLNRIQRMQQELRDEREKVENDRKEKERLSRERMGSTYYTRSQSTPVLPEPSPYVRGRANARSNDSFQSTSSQEHPDYRRVWSRTPSVSSNDRSPPPAPHWQRVEQARRERERERAMQKLAEARALEKKAYAEAWGVYESRWMLLNFATRTSPIISTNTVSALSLSFHDIPWPLLHPPQTCIAITTVAIKLFLAEQATDKSHRDRIKEALLRWHPDRFESRIMEHVRMDCREEVKKGVDIVVRCLNELLSKA